MRGAYRTFQRCCALIIALILVTQTSIFLHPLEQLHASNTLDVARDTVANAIPSFVGVNHDVYFVLPTSAQQIRSTDWILFDFPQYTDLTAPTDIIGGFGTPIFSVSGTKARITGISLLPGQSLSVIGITATNPDLGESTIVTFMVADNSTGLTPRNQVSVIPTPSNAVVNVTATVVTQMAGLTISGLSSPNSFNTLTENGNTIATATADGTGVFTFTVTAVDPGNHTYRIFSTDGQNRTSSQISLSLFMLANQLTEVSDIVLSPTISEDKTSIPPGDPITFSGMAAPSSQINIFTESPLKSYTTTSNSAGAWSYTLSGTETSSYAPGEYQTYATVQLPSSVTSLQSPTVLFTVTSGSSGTPPSCNINHGDLNCDGNTNLFDFSIMLFYWGGTDPTADVNGDGVVNLFDFSIMLFYFSF